MSFKAKLVLNGREYNILEVNYGLFRETDATGRPSTITRGGKVELTVEATGEATFFEWMTNNYESRDGSVRFIRPDSEATLKELFFREAYMVKYKEDFDANSQQPLRETFVISAKEIEMNGGVHINEWIKMI